MPNITHHLSVALFALSCSSNDTQLVGWPPSFTTRATAAIREIGATFGATPDTFALSPRNMTIVFRDPPFAPVWASQGPRGGTICHDLGMRLLRQIALPIAREMYRLSPASNEVDTVSVALFGHARRGIIGSCTSRPLLRFRPEELGPLHGDTASGHL
jgi:hypothetical protein